MAWADPNLEWLLDEVPTRTGGSLANALNSNLTIADRQAAADALSDPTAAVMAIRRILNDVADLLEATDGDLDACAARIAAGASFREVFMSIPVRPGCAVGFFSDWEYVPGRFTSASSALGRIAVTEPGQVSDVLAWDKEMRDGMPLAFEFVSQVCPRALLPDGREAVLLPPRVAAVRTFEPAKAASHLLDRSDVPASSYLQLTGLSSDQMSAVVRLGVRVLEARADRQVSVTRPAASPRSIV